jgi:hypothetical protein
MKSIFPIALIVGVPIEALNYHLLDVCSVIDGCGKANFVEVLLANISIVMHLPTYVIVLKSGLTSTPIASSLGTPLLLLNGYIAAVLLSVGAVKMFRYFWSPGKKAIP